MFLTGFPTSSDLIPRFVRYRQERIGKTGLFPIIRPFIVAPESQFVLTGDWQICLKHRAVLYFMQCQSNCNLFGLEIGLQENGR